MSIQKTELRNEVRLGQGDNSIGKESFQEMGQRVHGHQGWGVGADADSVFSVALTSLTLEVTKHGQTAKAHRAYNSLPCAPAHSLGELDKSS